MKSLQSNYPFVRVSTLDFILVISGHYDFDGVIQNTFSDNQREAYEKLCGYSLEQKSPCFSDILARLNQDISDYKYSTSFDEIMFPTSHGICTKTSRLHDDHWKYTIGDLIDWISTRYDLTDYILADWFKEELKKRTVVEDTTHKDFKQNNEYTKLDALPKFIQLAINLHNTVDWSGDTSENFLTPLFLEVSKQLNFPQNETPTLNTDKHGKNSLTWPKLQHNEKTLSKPIFEGILKMIKPNK